MEYPGIGIRITVAPLRRCAQEDAGDGGDGEGGSRQRSMRPTTARRRPPPVKEAAREVSAKEAASAPKKAQGIMIDGQNDEVGEGGAGDIG